MINCEGGDLFFALDYHSKVIFDDFCKNLARVLLWSILLCLTGMVYENVNKK